MKLTSLKLHRLQRHLMQPEVAKRAAIGWQRLAEIEGGLAEPLPDELSRLAAALDVAPEDLCSAAPLGR
jgi:transcriptional regulator with XRE-family HTH domain